MDIFRKEKIFAAVREDEPYLVIREDRYEVKTDEKGQKIITCFGYCPFNGCGYIGKATCMTEDMKYYSYFLGTKIAVIKASIGCLKDLIKYLKIESSKEVSELEELITASNADCIKKRAEEIIEEHNNVIKYFRRKLKYCYEDLYTIKTSTYKRNYEMYKKALEKIRRKKNGHI